MSIYNIQIVLHISVYRHISFRNSQGENERDFYTAYPPEERSVHRRWSEVDDDVTTLLYRCSVEILGMDAEKSES